MLYMLPTQKSQNDENYVFQTLISLFQVLHDCNLMEGGRILGMCDCSKEERDNSRNFTVKIQMDKFLFRIFLYFKTT